MHGSVTGGATTWRKQLPLARRWTLLVVERPGFGSCPPAGERVDFAVDAPLVAEVLGDGAHLVGQSYGGVVSLLAAAQRPEAVRSLTVIEPPAFAVAAGEPGRGRVRQARQGALGDRPGGSRRPSCRCSSTWSARRNRRGSHRSCEQGARLLRTERGPWEAEIPLDELAAASFPKLVVSGAHDPAFDAVCDVLERRLGAERAVIPGADHSVQRTEAPFNERLEAFLERAPE